MAKKYSVVYRVTLEKVVEVEAESRLDAIDAAGEECIGRMDYCDMTETNCEFKNVRIVR